MRALSPGLLAVLSTFAALAACGPRAGYGVLLWAPTGDEGQEAVPQLGSNGAIVPLQRESRLQNAYWVAMSRPRRLVEVPVWRFRAFGSRKEAEQYAAAYAPLAHVYAYSLRRGLPLREAPRQDAKIVYKLGAQQLIKVLWRAERPQKAGVYSNTWYRVLTEDGFEGFCYGQYLKLFQTRADPREEARALQTRDENLARILSGVWRPEYFREMIDKKRLDLRRFRDDIGFFPEASARRVRIQKALASYQFAYKDVRKLSTSVYQFEGTDLRVEVLAEDRLVASYPTPERLVSEVYLLIEEDVEELIAKERERRQGLYKPFAGLALRSSAYGTLEFGAETDMTFVWKGYERLVPAVVPAGAGERGRVDFRYWLDGEASRRYDGVMTLRFAALAPEREVNFFYKREGSALRLVTATPRGGDDLLMRLSSAGSWVLFFE